MLISVQVTADQVIFSVGDWWIKCQKVDDRGLMFIDDL